MTTTMRRWGTAKQQINPADVSRIPRWSAWLSSASQPVRQEIAQQDLDNQYFKDFFFVV